MHKTLYMEDFDMVFSRRFLLRSVIFLLVLGWVIRTLNLILMPKFFYSCTWPTTSTYIGFYKMEKESVDVLFLGSSHAASFFNPQVLYDRYGITGYNLGCEQQNLAISYFWLKEALRFQKPKAVVLESYMLFPYLWEEPLNTAESCTRKAIDAMRWSSVKWEAVHAICEADKKQSLSSYYLPNIRFHTRWTMLNEEDFSYPQMGRHYELKGFAPIGWRSWTEFLPFVAEDSGEEEPMVEVMEKYLEKITELCQEQGISLLLVKTPSVTENIGKYRRVQRYAAEHGVTFLDFNEKTAYQEIGYQLATDNCDPEHGNIWGATKVTSYLGDLLRRQYGLESRTDSQWEGTKGYYAGVEKDYTLSGVTDMGDYLEMIRDERYCVMLAIKDEGTSGLREDLREGMKNLGLDADFDGKYRCSYYGIVEDGKTKEGLGYERLDETGTIRGGRNIYEITSAGYESGNMCSIRIDGTEYAKNMRGINIVVYNSVTKTVVDSVCFDTFEQEAKAYR